MGAESTVPLQIMKLPGVKIRRYRKTQGRCFEIVFLFVVDNPRWTIVHGTIDINFRGRRAPGYIHAWAKRGDYIFEPENNCIFLRDEWEGLKPKEIKTYSIKKAAKEMIDPKNRKRQGGPWDPVFYARGENTPRGFLE